MWPVDRRLLDGLEVCGAVSCYRPRWSYLCDVLLDKVVGNLVIGRHNCSGLDLLALVEVLVDPAVDSLLLLDSVLWS